MLLGRLSLRLTVSTKFRDVGCRAEELVRVDCAGLDLWSARRAFLVSARRCPGDVLVESVAPPVAMIAAAFAVQKLRFVGF